MAEPQIDLHTGYLHKIREEWLSSAEADAALKGSSVLSQTECTIAGKEWQQSIYSDFSGDRNFVVFELRRKRLIFERHRNIGCEILNGSYILLSGEELWKEGIP